MKEMIEKRKKRNKKEEIKRGIREKSRKTVAD